MKRRRKIAAYVGVPFGLFCAVLLVDAWIPFGKSATGERLERMKASPVYDGDEFENPLPLWNDEWGMVVGFIDASAFASPNSPVNVVQTDPRVFTTPPDTGLRVTWLGHSTVLIEIEGVRLLTDPIFGKRTSPISFIGPKRWYAPPLPLEALPKLDAVLISHDHYDHLDQPTIDRLKDVDVPFIAPLGVGAHLEYWGVPATRITEVDWWQTVPVGHIQIVTTPARHASGRHLFDQNATLWAGYALLGKQRRVYFSGDTGLFPELSDVGAEYGPFDLTMVEVGAYARYWPDWHIGPEQAIQAHRMLRGNVFLPIHWGLFDLALHGWTEPLERVLVAAKTSSVAVVAPRPGEPIEPTITSTIRRWWPEVPWETAEQHPIVSTGMP